VRFTSASCLAEKILLFFYSIKLIIFVKTIDFSDDFASIFRRL